MKISICVPTRNRPDRLDACLKAIWSSQVKAFSVVVSDDSPEEAMRQNNHDIVEKYPGTTYLVGPQKGLSANRNNAVNAVKDSDFVAFIDDDVLIDSDLIANAIARYAQLPEVEQSKTILSGVSRTLDGTNSVPVKLSFGGYFCQTDTPQSAETKTAFFPRHFFDQEQWDTNIFIGQEDAELCLRALKRGYKILHCPELGALDTGFGVSTLKENKVTKLSDYEIYIEASRFYIGVKRYLYLFPNLIKFLAFLIVFLGHMIVYLLRRRSLESLPLIIARSNIDCLFYSLPENT
jgi:glycosyltransferase involved in cell wall biosynthesis